MYAECVLKLDISKQNIIYDKNAVAFLIHKIWWKKSIKT